MRRLGVRFGKALQLTNVLRDVPRDLRHGRCYLPREGLARARPVARRSPRPAAAAGGEAACSSSSCDTALDHYEAGWQYTFAIPSRGAAACDWRACGRSPSGFAPSICLARSPNWLDPAVTLKVPRARVYGLMAHSLGTVWSTRALGRQARGLRARIPL